MFELALKTAIAKLRAAKAEQLLEDFALIGAFAVSRWATPRATGDIDFVISSSKNKLPELASFCAGELRLGDVKDPLLATISFEINDENGAIPIQLVVLPPSWEKIALLDVLEEDLGEMIVPIVNWPALVLLKLYAGSALDLQDAKNVLLSVDPSETALQPILQTAKSLRVDRRMTKLIREIRNAEG